MLLLLSHKIAPLHMELQYRGKHILAPMVCGGTLPFRMLAAKYGADMTYGEEVVGHRLLRSTRKINKILGTVDLVEKDTDAVVFWTCDEEKICVVFHIGTSDAVQAVQAANLVSGSPSNLTTLERSLNIPVTCEICLLKTHHDNVELAGQIEKTGAAAIAVHGRMVADR
ncbi:hypothetical protein CY35_02G144600 [Sphagnum magellanicum]|nr:hypothetical protein CY35_02G144600 [Sphagnum magellanicum]